MGEAGNPALLEFRTSQHLPFLEERSPPGATSTQLSVRLEELCGEIARRSLAILGDWDVAEDVAQETVTRVIQRLRSGGPPIHRLGPFARGVARHVTADVRREESRTVPLGRDGAQFPAVAGDLEGVPAEIEDEELHLLLREEVERLSDPERTVVEGCFFDGLTCAEIARRTGEPASRLRQRKCRALKHLRTALEYRMPETVLSNLVHH